MKHHLEYVGGIHDKFWQIVVNGSEFTTTWGRNGTKGTSQTKSFANEYRAMDAARKLLNEKLAKGYKIVPFPSQTPHPYTYTMKDNVVVDFHEIEETPDDYSPCILV